MRFVTYKHTLPGFLALVATMKAQEVLVPPPPTVTTPEAMQQTNEMQVFNPAEIGGASFPTERLFSIGPVTLHPHPLYRVLYGDGIQSSPGQQHTTVTHELSPGILLDIGSHLTVDYTPTLRWYSSSAFRDGVDHSASLNWGTAFEDWTFSASQTYSRSSTPLVETGAQTDQENYSTALNASYRFNSKISVDLGANQAFQFINSSTNIAQATENSLDWSTMDWLNYQFWPRLDVGIGAGFGYVNVENSPDERYEQLQARVNWRATDKVSFQVHAGGEDRQFLIGGSAPSVLNPIFGATVQYQPFHQTRISLDAERAVSASYFQNQITETTSLTSTLDQRLFGKFYLDLTAGYTSTQYIAALLGLNLGRTDDYYSFNARFSGHFLKRGTFAFSYQYSDNSSTQRGYSFSSSQVGFEIGCRY